LPRTPPSRETGSRPRSCGHGARGEGRQTGAHRTRKPKADERHAGNGEAADTGSQAGGATAAAEPTGPSDDDLRNAATTYIQGAGEDKASAASAAANIKSITDHFGTKTLVGETGITDPTQRDAGPVLPQAVRRRLEARRFLGGVRLCRGSRARWWFRRRGFRRHRLNPTH
jgi:hypothetical protein